MNPIEMAFAKLKALLRQEPARRHCQSKLAGWAGRRSPSAMAAVRAFARMAIKPAEAQTWRVSWLFRAKAAPGRFSVAPRRPLLSAYYLCVCSCMRVLVGVVRMFMARGAVGFRGGCVLFGLVMTPMRMMVCRFAMMMGCTLMMKGCSMMVVRRWVIVGHWLSPGNVSG